MPGIDILIPTYHADFVWLDFCLRSVKKFTSGFRNVIIVSDNDGHKIPQSILNIMPVTVIYKDVPTKWPAKLNHRPGYLWQQILKLSWMDYTDADAVLILDSDEMLVCNVTPSTFRDYRGRWRWAYRNWENAGSANMWKLPTQEILQFEPQYEAMCFAPFIFERKITDEFIEYLKQIHGATDLFDVFFKYDMTLFSEYNAYGSYILKFDNDVYYSLVNEYKGHNNVITKSWSYGGVSNEEKEKREKILYGN
jgi:hypothetical protein